MSASSEDDFSDIESENCSEGSSESSGVSFCSANENFSVYDEETEPIANAQEVAEYAVRIAEEEEEDQMFLSRFAGETDLGDWCKCSKCSLEFVVNRDECRCCMEVDKCRQRMEEVKKVQECITAHPGFANVCLNRWVLGTAAIGLKTKKKKSYAAVFAQGNTAENEFLRSVAYRQFVRMVWEYVGASNRLPLPCCVYNVIRKEFPHEPKEPKEPKEPRAPTPPIQDLYHGYEEDDSD